MQQVERLTEARLAHLSVLAWCGLGLDSGLALGLGLGLGLGRGLGLGLGSVVSGKGQG